MFMSFFFEQTKKVSQPSTTSSYCHRIDDYETFFYFGSCQTLKKNFKTLANNILWPIVFSDGTNFLWVSE